MGLLNLHRAADTLFCPDLKPGFPKCHVSCMSSVAAEGSTGQVCIMLAQKAFMLSWVELSPTRACEESVALGRGRGGGKQWS